MFSVDANASNFAPKRHLSNVTRGGPDNYDDDDNEYGGDDNMNVTRDDKKNDDNMASLKPSYCESKLDHHCPLHHQSSSLY